MSSPSFARLEPGYAKLWAEIEPLPQHRAAIEAICRRQLAHKATFQAVEKVSGVPWWWVAVTDQMEGGGGARTFLGNGQSLARPTTEVPAGEGPFSSFEAGAVRALIIDGLMHLRVTWTVEYAAYRWEGFNGWGYLHLPIEDPYLAAQSNKESPGKYTSDHHFDPNARSGQPGALTILKVLATLDSSIDLSGGASPSVAPPVVAQPQETTMDLTTLIPLLIKLIPAALKAIDFVKAESGKPIDVVVNDVVSHLTPGQPNAPALGPNAKG